MALSASDVWEALDQKLMAAGVKLDMEAQDAEAAEQTIQALAQVDFRQPRIECIYMVAQVYGGILNDLWPFSEEKAAKDFARELMPDADYDSERDEEDTGEGGYNEILVESNNLFSRDTHSVRVLTLASGE